MDASSPPASPPRRAVTPDLLTAPRGARGARDAATTEPRHLIGLDRSALAAAVADAAGSDPKQARMRANQLWRWLYVRGARSFDEMTDIGKSTRSALSERCEIARPEIVERQVSEDGTRKYLLRLSGGHEVEAVYIPEEDRGTLCVSSQVGCTLSCTFCHTGTQKLVRNLTAGEIVAQVLLCRDDLGEWPKPGERPQDIHEGGRRLLSNIVLMGMGEPLYNFEGVRDALSIIMDGEGLSLSRRRVTLSTSGVVPAIQRAGEEIGCLLAISLHATTDDLRDILVPINRKWNLDALMRACREYPRLSNAERITFEYVMLKDVNDSDADAKRLLKLIRGIPAKINLIPFNPWPGAPYECSDWERIEAFAEIVHRAGYASPIRTPRGRDILAACGQLKSETERVRGEKVLLSP